MDVFDAPATVFAAGSAAFAFETGLAFSAAAVFSTSTVELTVFLAFAVTDLDAGAFLAAAVVATAPDFVGAAEASADFEFFVVLEAAVFTGFLAGALVVVLEVAMILGQIAVRPRAAGRLTTSDGFDKHFVQNRALTRCASNFSRRPDIPALADQARTGRMRHPGTRPARKPSLESNPSSRNQITLTNRIDL
ncbi:MAG TPA: hypothetical protein VFS42_07010 [Burkholderiaceae bacterium]|nr:hypothetical protein [Burkholderiaceae bacterium]